MSTRTRKVTEVTQTTNIFPGLDSSHFNDQGFLNKKGVRTLVNKLRNKDSELYNVFGEAGTDLFFDYYSKHKEDPAYITQLSRDIIIANTILFNEELKGPDSSLVRQTSHLFSPIGDKNTEAQLRKLLIKMAVIGKNELVLTNSYNSFMDLYLADASKFGIHQDTLSHELSTILRIARAKISGLREFDILYANTHNRKVRKKILKDSEEYLKKLSIGVFANSISIVDFFNSRGYPFIAKSVQGYALEDGNSLSGISQSYSSNYEDVLTRSPVVHNRIKDLHNQIGEQLKKYRRRLS